MGRRAKSPKGKAEAKRPLARKSPKTDDARVRDLEKRLAEALDQFRRRDRELVEAREQKTATSEALQEKTRALTEALEQQTATAEILGVISRSPTDVQPVFDAIAESATRLCGAVNGVVSRFDGELIHAAAHHNIGGDELDAIRSVFPIRPGRGSVTGRAIESRRIVHVEDLAQDPEYEQARVVQAGFRTALSVPMLREGVPIGAINVMRMAVAAFTPSEIALLQTFADQAVIAIENVRLFNETKEALEQQTATSEILRVISSSPTDARPVFDVIAQNAMRLCDGSFCAVSQYDGAVLHLVAHAHVTAEGIESMRQLFPLRPSRATVAGRVVIGGTVVHIPDVQTDPEYLQPFAEALRARSGFGVPMLRDGATVGVIVVGRFEARPFTEREITLVQTFADQAVIAIENVRLFTELEEKNKALTTAHAQVSESLDQQTATSEILRVIASSPTDVQPVFDTIVRNVVALCGSIDGMIWRYEGDLVHLVGHHNLPPHEEDELRRIFPMHITSAPLHRAIRAGGVKNLTDIDAAPEVTASTLARWHRRGIRSVLVAPMRRRGDVVGAIAVSHREVGAFSPSRVELLKTFADQAVIAIENVRLFTELQEKNRAVTEALERQTATSDILRVISQSPTDVQPVFDTIVRSAVRLCDGLYSALHPFDGELIHLVAQHNFTPEALEAAHRIFPARPTRALLPGRAILERAVIHIPDVEIDPEPQSDQGLTRAVGWRSGLFVPMLREGAPIGVIVVARAEPGPFSDNEIKLLQTFADQAVIAIENVRLFNELQTSNRELTTALDKQTATSDILAVISRSQTDVQPVFDAIVTSAVRLLGGYAGTLTRVVGDHLELVAITSTDPSGDAAVRARFPQSLRTDNPHTRTVRARTPLNIADAHAEPSLSDAMHAYARVRGFRSQVVVPLLRHDEAAGTIAVTRREPGGFTDDEVALLKTFADQAVIAIENARLLTELQSRTSELTRSVGELTALGEVGRALSSTLDLETVLQTIVMRANELAGTAGCAIWEYDAAREEFRLRASDYVDEEDAAALGTEAAVTTIRRGQGVTSQVMEQRQPVQIDDIAIEGAEENPIRQRLIAAGHHALLAVPLLREDEVLGVLVVTRKASGEFQPEVVQLLSTFATQSALAIQNARLFREIELKSRELEVASQHKSEFLANMSHELRTPLNAIIGFSEVLAEGMFGEINDKQAEYLRDILESGRHLLSLINDILDLSKIEAGRMELELTNFDLPGAVETALILVRERASRRGIALGKTMDECLGTVRGDERKVKQVLLNLLSNALKFTPEGGRIDVRATVNEGMAEVSVADTGVGIAPEDQGAIFEEFRQVGTADKKVEGTGLGLALSRKFIELHGGRIWVKSQVGQGSTFTFTLPVRRSE